jgi:hypothetical protein
MKRLVLILILLIVVPLAGVLVFVARPELFVDNLSLKALPWIFKKAGIDARWDQGQVSIQSHSFRQKSLHLDLTGLCLNLKSPDLQGCFKRLQIDVRLRLGLPVEILELKNVTMVSDDLRLTLLPSPSPKKEKTDSQAPVSIRHMKVGHIEVDIAGFRISTATEKYLADFTMTSDESGMGVGLDLKSASGKLRLDSHLTVKGQTSRSKAKLNP